MRLIQVRPHNDHSFIYPCICSDSALPVHRHYNPIEAACQRANFDSERSECDSNWIKKAAKPC